MSEDNMMIDEEELTSDIPEDDVKEGIEEVEEVVEAEKIEDGEGADESTESLENEEDFSDEMNELDLDEIADTAIEVLQTILKPFDVGDITIDEYEGDEGELILDITGDDLAVLIGRHGKTLDAIQFLVSIINKRKLGYRYPVIIDVEGYKSRLRQKIESIARSAASRAVTQNREIGLRPMSPYERRIVHITLKDDPKVETESEGEGSERHVVVFPV